MKVERAGEDDIQEWNVLDQPSCRRGRQADGKEGMETIWCDAVCGGLRPDGIQAQEGWRMRGGSANVVEKRFAFLVQRSTHVSVESCL